jgi:hypothetical protein
MLSNKERYSQHCIAEASIPLFSRDWWLDAVCEGEENWDVAIVEKGGIVVASMPYYIKKKYGFVGLSQPRLTQILGPWLKPSQAKYSKQLADQKSNMHALLDQLPPHHYFRQNWSYLESNWLPFYWRGYQARTNFTYILHDCSDEEKLWSGLQSNIRREIRKAEERHNLVVRDDLALDAIIQLNRMTFKRQGKKVPYSDELFYRIDAACSERNCRNIFVAEDSDGNRHAGVYTVWDENSAYYLVGGGDPNLRNSGATSLCMWRAILAAGKVTKDFDFEGSMMEDVERFFRGFGAKQVPYLAISKTPSRLLRVSEAIKHVCSN